MVNGRGYNQAQGHYLTTLPPPVFVLITRFTRTIRSFPLKRRRVFFLVFTKSSRLVFSNCSRRATKLKFKHNLHDAFTRLFRTLKSCMPSTILHQLIYLCSGSLSAAGQSQHADNNTQTVTLASSHYSRTLLLTL